MFMDGWDEVSENYDPVEIHEIDDLWNLCEDFSVADAAALIAGYNPSMVERCANDTFFDRAFPRYQITLKALTSAIKNKKLKAEEGSNTISRDDIVSWLSGRGVRTGFFFLDSSDAPDYLDKNNARYAAKLAAAVRAWQAVTDVQGRTPKQALAKWLREHAAEFGMTDDEGKPNETAIEEASKLANWQPGGGAPKTLSE